MRPVVREGYSTLPAGDVQRLALEQVWDKGSAGLYGRPDRGLALRHGFAATARRPGAGPAPARCGTRRCRAGTNRQRRDFHSRSRPRPARCRRAAVSHRPGVRRAARRRWASWKSALARRRRPTTRRSASTPLHPTTSSGLRRERNGSIPVWRSASRSGALPGENTAARTANIPQGDTVRASRAQHTPQGGTVRVPLPALPAGTPLRGPAISRKGDTVFASGSDIKSGARGRPIKTAVEGGGSAVAPPCEGG